MSSETARVQQNTNTQRLREPRSFIGCIGGCTTGNIDDARRWALEMGVPPALGKTGPEGHPTLGARCRELANWNMFEN
eukprot:626069-Amorphochlora_amoeboformis.AAC.2